jgi:hypothetical protein
LDPTKNAVTGVTMIQSPVLPPTDYYRIYKRYIPAYLEIVQEHLISLQLELVH